MLRLLTNLETESEKLLQIVLFAQPELNERLKQYNFRQLNQRIAFSYFLKSLNYKELKSYLYHRLAVAGCTKEMIFKLGACRLLFKASRGIPRLINILCHKAMLAAYGKGKKQINTRFMMQAVKDSKDILNKKLWC